MVACDWFFLVFFWLPCAAGFSEESPLGLFPDDYNKEEPPWEKGKPARVYVQLDLMDISNIDESNMEFHVSGFVDEFWTDPRLNVSMFKGTIFPSYLEKDIWMPDLVMDSVKHGAVFQLSLPNTNVIVNPDGSFMKTTRYFLVGNCNMNFEFYPMDTQYCHIEFASMSYETFKVDLNWVGNHPNPMPSIDIVGHIESSKYLFKEPRADKVVKKRNSGSFAVLFANFTFERRLSSTVFNVYIPSTLIVLLSWISFWIDIMAAPARITLGVTSLLTLTTQMVQAKSKLPTISYMNAVDVWLLACLFMVFSSLIEFAVCYHRYILIEKSAYATTTVRKMNGVRTRKSGLEERSSERPLGEAAGSNKRDMLLDQASRKLFPSLFAVFTASYWSYYLTIKK